MAKKKSTPKYDDQEILYPELDVLLYSENEELTCAQAEKYLRWESESEGEKFGADYLLTDENETKVRCPANNNNRPFDKTHARVLQGEILRGNWRLNGETIVIGKYGQVLSGQHRLVALVLAGQEWDNNSDKYPTWSEEPTMPCVIIVGVEEDDSVVNTIDTGKPRTLSEVIYRSHYFEGKTNREKEALSKICADGVSLLAYRSGLDREAFCVGKRTHADSLEILERHITLLKAVKHVYDESHGSGTHLREFIPLGWAAALLYLMGSSTTDSEKYRNHDHPSENLLEWDRWDEACEFIVLLSQDVPEMNAVREELARLNELELKKPLNQCHVLVKAWLAFLEHGAQYNLKAKDVQLETKESEDGEPFVNPTDYPSVGGIDLGNPKDPLIEPDSVEDDEPESESKPAKKAPAKKASSKNTSTKKAPAKKKASTKTAKKKSSKKKSSSSSGKGKSSTKKTAKKKSPTKKAAKKKTPSKGKADSA